jgi:hypothetical protein
MATYRAELDTILSPERAFAYLSEFSNVREWDPGVVDARAEGEGRYRVTIAMLGRHSDLVYRDRPRAPPHFSLDLAARPPFSRLAVRA